MPADPLSITFRLRGMERTKLCTTSPTLSVVIPSCGSNASNSLRRWLARALFVHHRRSQRFLVPREDPFPHVSNICRRVVNMIFADIADKELGRASCRERVCQYG